MKYFLKRKLRDLSNKYSIICMKRSKTALVGQLNTIKTIFVVIYFVRKLRTIHYLFASNHRKITNI